MNERENERERDLEWGEITSKKATGKALLCVLSLSFPFVSVREKTDDERERRKNCFVFASDALCATREAARSFRRRRRHQKQRDC